MSIIRSLNTVRYLKPVQVVSRVTRHLRPRPGQRAPTDTHGLRTRGSHPAAPRHCRRWHGGSFRFLNETVSFAGADRWQPGGVSPLWHFQLHYFQYLDELDAPTAVQLMEDWMAANPPADGVGWHPYCLSMRIREWLEWLVRAHDLEPRRQRSLLNSLGYQVLVLESRLEYEHLANHLLENAITLCWAGLSLDGPLSHRWLLRGLSILETELKRQTLSDGTHDERSPMYQALIAEALLRLAAIADETTDTRAARVKALAGSFGQALLASLQHLVHPDGDYALVNDTALAVAPTVERLRARFPDAAPAVERRSGPWALPEAGYMGRRDERGGYLIFDAGPLGPDHNPAHGHADALAFEVSHRGRRLFTDTGVYTYSIGTTRTHDRGTSAHNTVEIDGKDQSELWAAFRCGRRISITGAACRQDVTRTRCVGEYVGPGRGLCRIRHRRSAAVDDGGIIFGDRVDARGKHTATIRLHLAPGLTPERRDDRFSIADEEGNVVARVSGAAATWRPMATPYHPEFGRELERICLQGAYQFADRLELSWQIELL